MPRSKGESQQPTRRSAAAYPAADCAIEVVIGPLKRSRSDRDQHGPWSIVMDVPHPDRDMAGPHPVYVALAAWASCTTVTLIGVAHRSGIGLEDVAVDFAVETKGPAAGFGVHKTIRLIGDLDADADAQVALQRAADHCSLSQIFMKGALVIDDRVEYELGLPARVSRSPNGDAVAALPVGSVRSRHLSATKEYENGKLAEEGEVTCFFSCENFSGPGRWAILAGHTMEGWVPPPAPLVLGALAGSTAATIRHLVGLVDFRVEIASLDPPRGRDRAQADATACIVGQRHIRRTVFIQGTVSANEDDLLRRALEVDPLTESINRQDALISERFEVRPAT